MILDATRHWECPNCKFTDVTHEAQPHTRFHACAGLGLTAPMIPEGQKVRVTAVEREDYIGEEHAGRIMSVVTERPDGSNDVMVMAPSAVGKGEAHGLD